MFLKSGLAAVRFVLVAQSQLWRDCYATLCRRLAQSLLMTIVVAASACATFQPEPPEVQVQKRATKFVAALRAGERETAFSYATPAYQSSSSPARLAGRYAGVVNWTEAVVSDVACEAARCEVEILITYQMVRPRIENTRPLEQIWIDVDGEWYLYP